jgi:hypothetical protein
MDKMKGAMFGKDRELPMGLKKKDLSVGEGAGELRNYADTAEEITAVQDSSARKLKQHEMPKGYRQ